MQTAERVASHEHSDNVIYQRHLVAYNTAADLIYGNVLEVGCGEGYGVPILAPKTDHYVAVDKFQSDLDKYKSDFKQVEFYQTSVPPLKFENDSFDCLVSFQVIEHIEEDETLVKEMARVFKTGRTDDHDNAEYQNVPKPQSLAR